jgi:selenocysteine lyase/cysteine desulfurase
LVTFTIDGVDLNRLIGHLFSEHRIIVTGFVNFASVNGIRVTPNVFSTLSEVDLFAEAVERVIQKGFPA